MKPPPLLKSWLLLSLGFFFLPSGDTSLKWLLFFFVFSLIVCLCQHFVCKLFCANQSFLLYMYFHLVSPVYG